MVDLYLVTTADESTWPHDKPIVFLGEWCKVNSRKIYWDKLQSETVDYHWDSSLKMKTDYIFLQQVYEELLKEISEYLNSVHDENHSIKYWRIVIGPWLGSFIHILFDRFSMLKLALKNYDITSCIVHSKNINNFIANDMLEYASQTRSDSWNEFIYGQLLSDCFDLKIELINQNKNNKDSKKNHKKNKEFLKKCQSFFHNLYLRITQNFVDTNEHFFLSTYLPLFLEIKLQLKLGQFPKIWKNYHPKVSTKNRVNRTTINTIKSREFKSLAHKMALLHIPKAYLEGYQDIVEQTLRVCHFMRMMCLKCGLQKSVKLVQD